MVWNELHKIQKELKAPKGQYNSFGKYKYRSCEDIVEAVKAILPDGFSLLLSDEIILIGDRFYVKATASLASGNDMTSVSAYAREPENKKGMDPSQITGTASSYARKYALNGLFAIDDTKDADTDEHKNQSKKDDFEPTQDFKTEHDLKKWVSEICQEIAVAKSPADINAIEKNEGVIRRMGQIPPVTYTYILNKISQKKNEFKTIGEKNEAN